MLAQFLKNLRGGFGSKPATLAPSFDSSAASAEIAGAIRERRPFLASRLGWEEAKALVECRTKPEVLPAIAERLWRHAGVFPPTANQLDEFCEEYFRAIAGIDLLGLMHSPYEAELLERYGKNPLRCDLGALEPYLNDEPWSAQLAGLRVLVIHPFVESIGRQYREARSRIFSDPRILPEFELLLLKPPQTIAGNTDGFVSWTDALKDLKQRVVDHSFDVAIVGCGAYGMPIGTFIKDLGKVCIHLGGATQLLFGITGARWREQPTFKALETDAWRTPLESERPEGWEKVEKGCYW